MTLNKNRKDIKPKKKSMSWWPN